MLLEEGNLVSHVLGMWGAAANRGAVGGGAKRSDLKRGGVCWLFQIAKVQCEDLHVIVDDLPIVLRVVPTQLWVDYVRVLLQYCCHP